MDFGEYARAMRIALYNSVEFGWIISVAKGKIIVKTEHQTFEFENLDDFVKWMD